MTTDLTETVVIKQPKPKPINKYIYAVGVGATNSPKKYESHRVYMRVYIDFLSVCSILLVHTAEQVLLLTDK